MARGNNTDEAPVIIPAITGNITYDNPLFTMPKFLTPYKIPILSYTASLFSTAVGFPLDSIKTRMQTHTFSNAYQCFKYTIHIEGVRGLFRGIVAPLLSTSFSRSLGVTIFTDAKPIVSSALYPIWGYEPLISSKKASNKQLAAVINNMPVSFISGGIAGAVVSTFACPFELTKIFQQIIMLVNSDTAMNMTSDRLPTSLLDVTKSIIKYEGVSGLYSGFRYHILRDSCSSGLFYGIYETVKLGLQSLSAKAKEDDFIDESFKSNFDVICVPVAGALAGCMSWITVFPIDTVKAQYQRDIVGNIIRAHSGLGKIPVVAKRLRFPTRDMYKGLGPSITRSILITTIFFSLFEGLMKNIA